MQYTRRRAESRIGFLCIARDHGDSAFCDMRRSDAPGEAEVELEKAVMEAVMLSRKSQLTRRLSLRMLRCSWSVKSGWKR